MLQGFRIIKTYTLSLSRHKNGDPAKTLGQDAAAQIRSSENRKYFPSAKNW